MMNKLLLVLSIFIAFCNSAMADEQRKVTLNSDTNKEQMIELPYANIFVSIKGIDDDGNANISIEVENIHEANSLILFDRAYDEKTIKKMKPSLIYDKIFGGSKGARVIENGKDIKSMFRIRSSEREEVTSLMADGEHNLTCRMPIYIAKNKDKKGAKLLLLEKTVLELDIEVQIKPDEVYLNFNDTYNQLIEDIQKEKFCTNKNHKGTSYQKLKKQYEDKIAELKDQITNTVKTRDYKPSSNGYKKFMEIAEKLDSIDIESYKVDHCSLDAVATPAHSCKYCNLSYKQLHDKLQNIYIQIHNGKNKASFMAEVKAIKACIDSNKKRKNDGARARCLKDYEDIMKL